MKSPSTDGTNEDKTKYGWNKWHQVLMELMKTRPSTDELMKTPSTDGTNENKTKYGWN